MKNTFGTSVAVTLFGESHGPAVGAVRDGMAPGVYKVPEETDRAVMESKLAALGVTIDAMTPEQIEYMKSWQE